MAQYLQLTLILLDRITFLYHDTLNFSGSNQTAHFRIRFNGKANYTQIGLTVIVDNTKGIMNKYYTNIAKIILDIRC